MANTATFLPDPGNTLYGTVGTPFSTTFTFDFVSDTRPNAYAYDIGFVSGTGVPLNGGYINGGTEVFFGVTAVTPTGNPTTDLTIDISGTPTVAGTYYVYVRGRWVDDDEMGTPFHNITPQVYTIIISGPPLAVTPAANVGSPTAVVPTATQSVAWVSDPFTISNGGGPYTITLSNAPATIGLSSVPSFPGTVNTTLTTGGTTFYLTGTPTDATAGTTITIQVTDTGSGQTYAGTYYKFICNDGGAGVMTITEVSRVGYPTNTGTCVQTHSFTVTFDAANTGTLPYSWTIGGGSLPPGLGISTVNNQGVISGVPTTVGSYSFNVIVNDSASHSRSVPVTLTPSLGANYTGGPLPSSGSINTTYGPTTLTATGGAGGANRWLVKLRNPNSSEAPGVFGGMTLTPASGGTDGGWAVVSNTTVTVGGTPNSPVPAGSFIVVKPQSDDGLGGWISGQEVAFPVVITGTNSLTISPGTLGIWTQNQSRSDTISVPNVNGPFTWAPATGLPAGITDTFTTSAVGTISGGYTGYGAFSVGISVLDNSSNSGAQNWTLTVRPDIWTNDTLTNGVRGASYSDSITFNGGDNTGFTYSVNTGTLPNGITHSISGAGNNTLNFTASNIQATAGTYNIDVAVTVPTTVIGGTYRKTFLIPITITGAGTVHLTPFTTSLCAKDSKAFPTQPKVRMGATVTGGTTNTYHITPPAGWTGGPVGGAPDGGAGPYPSFNATIWTQDVHTNGAYTFTLVSDEDPSASATVTVTVSTGTSQEPSISPAGPIYLFGGESQPLIPTMVGSCSNSAGNWFFENSIELSPGVWTLGGGCTLSAYRTGPVTLYAPASIPMPDTIFVGYHPDEDPDRYAQLVVNLVPGPRTNFQITTASPLPNGVVGNVYSQTLATSGGTGPYTWIVNTTAAPPPDPIVLSAAGVLSSPTPLTTPSTSNFAVTVKDSSTPQRSASKYFDLTVTGSVGTPTISTVSPNQGPIGGGTTVAITGTNFLAGDVIVFASTSAMYQLNATSTVINSPTSITAVTSNWGGAANEVTAVILRRAGIDKVIKNPGFTFMGGSPGFAVGSFSPTFATIGDGNKVIDVYGTGFDGSCSIKYTASWGGGEQTLSSQSLISGTTVRGTIASSNFSAAYAGTTARIKVVKVSDGSSAQSNTIFNVQATTLSVTTSSLPDGVRTQAYNQTLAATGGSGAGYSWVIASGSLPSGLSLGAGGDITGTVNAGATSGTFVVRVTDSLGAEADKSFTISVTGGALTITTASPLPDANINAVYSKDILASGGTAPLTFDIVSGNLPVGLSISSSGTISGTPTAANSAPVTFSFTVRVTDSAVSPLVTTKAYSLSLQPALSTVTVASFTPTSGPITGGTPVTITGTGFQNGCAVQFGGVAATNVVFTSSISIIATTPPAGAAGSVSVSVQNPDGGQGVLNGFEYKVLSTPVITGIDRHDGPFAGGQTVVLSGSNFQGISSIKFGLSEINSVVATFAPEDIVLGTVPQTVTLVTPPGITFGDGDTAVQVSIFVTNASGTTEFPAGEDGYTFRPPPIITSVVPSSGPTSGGQTVYVIGSNFFSRGNVKPRVFIGNVEVPASSITLVEQ